MIAWTCCGFYFNWIGYNKSGISLFNRLNIFQCQNNLYEMRSHGNATINSFNFKVPYAYFPRQNTGVKSQMCSGDVHSSMNQHILIQRAGKGWNINQIDIKYHSVKINTIKYQKLLHYLTKPDCAKIFFLLSISLSVAGISLNRFLNSSILCSGDGWSF